MGADRWAHRQAQAGQSGEPGPAAIHGFFSGAAEAGSEDRTGDRTAAQVQGDHVPDRTGDRHPYSTAQAGTGGSSLS